MQGGALRTLEPPAPAPSRGRWTTRRRAAAAIGAIGLILIGCALWLPVLPFVASPSVHQVTAVSADTIARFDAVSDPAQAAYFTLDSSGGLAVADRKAQVIRRFDASGQPIGTWGPNVGDTTLKDIAGIAFVGGPCPECGVWYVLDRSGPRIVGLDANGMARKSFSLEPQGPYGPSALAADHGDPNGNLYVADTGTGRILVYATDGQFQRALGSHGQQIDQFSQPMGVSGEFDGSVLVADWENGRVARWDSNGQPASVWNVGFRPWSVSADSDGRLYVIDPDTRKINVYSMSGDSLGTLDVPGTALSELNFPSQTLVGHDGRTLYVLGHNGIARVMLQSLPTTIAEAGADAVPRRVLGLLGLICLLAAAVVTGVRPPRPAFVARARRRPPTRRTWLSPDWTSIRISRRVEIICILLIVAVAVFVRAHDLTVLPHGMHGDEADSGIEAQRILQDGWIGLYSPLALGRPTGPLYLTAIPVALLGNTILAVRVVPMLMGVLTVVALYMVVRRSSSPPLALLAAGVLAVMDWHIHLSRIAFHPATWGLVVVLAAGAMLEAARTRSLWWWLIGGALAGFGVYFYQAAWVALAIFGVFAAVSFLVWLGDLWRAGGGLDTFAPVLLAGGACAGGVLIAILPMAVYAINPENGYFQSFDLVSSLTKPEYQQLPGIVPRAVYLAGRYLLFWNRLSIHPVLDTIDGTGEAPIVPPLQLVICVIGLLVGVRWWRNPLALLSAVMFVLAPIGSVVTLDGPARRVFELVPFLAILTAFAAYWVVASALRYRKPLGVALVSVVALVLGLVGYQNLHDYFGVFANSAGGDHWVFAQELTDAALYMAALPRGTHVYFYSDRWGVRYETTRFLDENVISEDRSREFSPLHVTDTDVTARPAVFVLIGNYRPLLQELQSKYPNGQTTYGGSVNDPTFIGYSVPDHS